MKIIECYLKSLGTRGISTNSDLEDIFYVMAQKHLDVLQKKELEVACAEHYLIPKIIKESWNRLTKVGMARLVMKQNIADISGFIYHGLKNNCKMEDLKDIARNQGLSVTGSEEDLISRLLESRGVAIPGKSLLTAYKAPKNCKKKPRKLASSEDSFYTASIAFSNRKRKWSDKVWNSDSDDLGSTDSDDLRSEKEDYIEHSDGERVYVNRCYNKHCDFDGTCEIARKNKEVEESKLVVAAKSGNLQELQLEISQLPKYLPANISALNHARIWIEMVEGEPDSSPRSPRWCDFESDNSWTNKKEVKFFGDTALIAAARRGEISMVISLLEAGADPTICSNKKSCEKTAEQAAQDSLNDVESDITMLVDCDDSEVRTLFTKRKYFKVTISLLQVASKLWSLAFKEWNFCAGSSKEDKVRVNMEIYLEMIGLEVKALDTSVKIDEEELRDVTRNVERAEESKSKK